MSWNTLRAEIEKSFGMSSFIYRNKNGRRMRTKLTQLQRKEVKLVNKDNSLKKRGHRVKVSEIQTTQKMGDLDDEHPTGIRMSTFNDFISNQTDDKSSNINDDNDEEAKLVYDNIDSKAIIDMVGYTEVENMIRIEIDKHGNSCEIVDYAMERKGLMRPRRVGMVYCNNWTNETVNVRNGESWLVYYGVLRIKETGGLMLYRKRRRWESTAMNNTGPPGAEVLTKAGNQAGDQLMGGDGVEYSEGCENDGGIKKGMSKKVGFLQRMAQAGDFNSMSLLEEPDSLALASQYNQGDQGASQNVLGEVSRSQDKEWPCPVDGCKNKPFKSERTMRNHVEKKHSGVTLEEGVVFGPKVTSTRIEVRGEKSKRKHSEMDANMMDHILDRDEEMEEASQEMGPATQASENVMERALSRAEDNLVPVIPEDDEDEFGDPNESIDRDRDMQIKSLDDELKKYKQMCYIKDGSIAELRAELVQERQICSDKEAMRQKAVMEIDELVRKIAIMEQELEELKNNRGGRRNSISAPSREKYDEAARMVENLNQVVENQRKEVKRLQDAIKKDMAIVNKAKSNTATYEKAMISLEHNGKVLEEAQAENVELRSRIKSLKIQIPCSIQGCDVNSSKCSAGYSHYHKYEDRSNPNQIDRRRMTACRDHFSQRGCRRGGRCNFSHNRELWESAQRRRNEINAADYSRDENVETIEALNYYDNRGGASGGQSTNPTPTSTRTRGMTPSGSVSGSFGHENQSTSNASVVFLEQVPNSSHVMRGEGNFGRGMRGRGRGARGNFENRVGMAQNQPGPAQRRMNQSRAMIDTDPVELGQVAKRQRTEVDDDVQGGGLTESGNGQGTVGRPQSAVPSQDARAMRINMERNNFNNHQQGGGNFSRQGGMNYGENWNGRGMMSNRGFNGGRGNGMRGGRGGSYESWGSNARW